MGSQGDLGAQGVIHREIREIRESKFTSEEDSWISPIFPISL